MQTATYLQSVLDVIASRVQSRYPSARALILTGSTARDEAVYMSADGRTVWLSDLECAVVLPPGETHLGEAATLAGIAAEIEALLSEQGTTIKIDLGPMPESALKSMPRTMFAYEFQTHGRYLFGLPPESVERLSPEDIPLGEAWRLLGNRMVERLNAETNGSRRTAIARFYDLAKQYIDLYTSLTLFAGRYTGSYRGRAAQMDDVIAWARSRIPGLDYARLREALAVAHDFRGGPGQPQYRWLTSCSPEQYASALEQHGLAWLDNSLPAFQSAIWDWELGQLSGVQIASGSQQALAALRRMHSAKTVLRQWAKAIACSRPRSVAIARAARLVRHGSPTALVYWCARVLAGPEPHAAEVNAVRDRLPMLYPGLPASSRDDLARQCVRNWYSYVR